MTIIYADGFVDFLTKNMEVMIMMMLKFEVRDVCCAAAPSSMAVFVGGRLSGTTG